MLDTLPNRDYEPLANMLEKGILCNAVFRHLLDSVLLTALLEILMCLHLKNSHVHQSVSLLL